MSWAIRCEELSKLYKIGKSNVTAAEMVNEQIRWMLGRLARPLRKTQSALPTPTTNHHTILDELQTQDAPDNHFWSLRDINLEVEQGDRVGIIGPNGCGKSCLLYTSPSPRD